MASRVKGFSALELSCALALGGLIVALAVPAMHRLAAQSAAVAAHNELRGAIAFARHQAVQLAVPVSLCASDDARHCNAGSDWSAGWIAFTDGAGAGTVEDDDQLLRTWAGPATGRAAVEVRGDRELVRFSARGLPGSGGTSVSWQIAVGDCEPGAVGLRTVTLHPTGAVRLERRHCP